MADEVRRSGRANKGHHTKNQDALDEPVAKSKAAPKADKKAQAQAKSETPRPQSANSAEPEEGGDEAVIRCVCGDQRDIRGRQMICCDSCEAWQHNKCLSLPEGDYWEDKTYYCEQCRPQDHQELLAAMARGEKPWARKKGSKPKARPSDVKADDKTKSQQPSNAPSPASHAAEAPGDAEANTAEPQDANGHGEGQAEDNQPQSPISEKRRLEGAPEKEPANKKRRKSSQPQAKTAPPTSPAKDIDALPQNQKALAEFLRDSFTPLIQKASDDRGFRIPDGDTPTSLSTRIALQISYAAFVHFGEPTGATHQYTARLRAISFNTKKNTILVDRLLSGSLTADELVKMAPEEMASEEKQKEYAAMREAAEKQMILTDEGGPRLRKTHKGEEIVGDDDYATHEFKQPNLREREPVLDDAPLQSPIGNRLSGSPAVTTHSPVVPDAAAAPDHVRRPSTNFDINSVLDKVKSPQNTQHAFQPRRQNSTQEKSSTAVVDADVDRLLKDEDEDVEMSGYSSDPTVCWQGSVSMQSMQPFDAVARFVAGGDFGQVVPWDKLLSNSLSIQGRIESAKGDDYIRGLGSSDSHDVAILVISPVTTEGRGVMDHLYNYFHSRKRWGVVPVDSGAADVLRDLYIIPIEAGGSNLPPFIDMLEHCTIETPRKEHMMLLALIAKLPEVKAPPPAQQHPPPPDRASNGPSNGPSPSPVTSTNPHAPQYPPHQQHQQPFQASPFPHQQQQQQQSHNTAPPAPPMHLPHLPPSASTSAQQQPPQPTLQAPPHHSVPNALSILGPYIDSPVIATLLQQNLSTGQVVSDVQMANLRHIVERIPEAREDMRVLIEHLRGSAQGGNGGGGGSGAQGGS